MIALDEGELLVVGIDEIRDVDLAGAGFFGGDLQIEIQQPLDLRGGVAGVVIQARAGKLTFIDAQMDDAIGVEHVGHGLAAFFDGGEAEFFVEGAHLGEAADVFAEGDGDLDVGCKRV